ncbi:MAG: RagB/SusD family nutrient uptake outer membrane protein [Tannerella sp.]|jgi:hypothetical protein|nr:RagB/SusD family nutrient uptake outer membrane protein [Tannerella sp.]
MKKILSILGIALLFLSCASDYLETVPQSSTGTSTIFESADNARLAINGICRLMVSQYLESQGMNGEGTIKTWYGNYPGNDFQKSNLSGWSPITNLDYTERATSTYAYYPWFYYYKLIGNANAIISNIDAASGPDGDKLFIKAQALTFRAYSYLMLSQLYCHRWKDSNNGASRGLPLRVDQSTGELPASTLAEVYQLIYNDLDEAIAGYKESEQSREKGDNYSPDLSVAYATYARSALTREDWTTAAGYAALARTDYPLMSNAEYVDGGFNTPNSEWIWSCYSASDQTLYYYSFFAYQGSNSSASVCRSYPCSISKELYNKIPDTDVRKGMFLGPKEGETYTTSSGRASSGAMYNRAIADYANKLYETSYIFAYMQFKFTVTDQPGIGHVNNFRTAEMYLIEAEANCHLGGKDTETQNLLIALNKTSGRNPDYACAKTGSDLLEEVKLYRKIELWGEGFDWFDYKRWKEPISRKTEPDGSFHSAFAVTINPSDKNQWTWVYPAKEVDYNDALNAYLE